MGEYREIHLNILLRGPCNACGQPWPKNRDEGKPIHIWADESGDVRWLCPDCVSSEDWARLPIGVPDDFAQHVKLMFDLQVLAFASDTTRVFSFKMGRDASSRVYPESGVTKGFHPASHHGNKPAIVTEFAQINKYHVSLLPYFMQKLQSMDEGGQTLLDKSLIIYGSPMGDSNVHNHKRCPLVLLGGAQGQLKGNVHHRAEAGTPMANVMLSALHMVGLDDIQQFGDSTGTFTL